MARTSSKTTQNFTKAALALHEIGWTPYPLLPDSGEISVDVKRWTQGLSPRRIRDYWRMHPNHGLGVSIDHRVFECDKESYEDAVLFQ